MKQHGRLIGLTWVHIISPRTINEARAGFNRLWFRRGYETAFGPTNYWKEIGLKNLRDDPAYYAIPLITFRDVNRNGNAHFSPRTYPAPYAESRTDIFRTLPHPAKTPVRIALFLNRFGIDSVAIVTNENAQEVALVLNFNLDRCRLGMT